VENLMKKLTHISGAAILLAVVINVNAQSLSYVTLNSQSGSTSYAVQPTQLVSVVGYCWNGNGATHITGYMADGSSIDLSPILLSNISTGASRIPQSATGLTNLVVSNFGWATFEIKTPNAQKMTFDYVPADCVVVPTSATGTVNIILESSADLQNWSASMPGSYNPVGQTNRFFRVRAVAN
jgi:hypothetical protein